MSSMLDPDSARVAWTSRSLDQWPIAACFHYTTHLKDYRNEPAYNSNISALPFILRQVRAHRLARCCVSGSPAASRQASWGGWQRRLRVVALVVSR